MRIKCLKKISGLLILLALSGNAIVVNAAGRGSAFSGGSTSFGIVASSAHEFDNDYVIFGVNIGYFVVDGLELAIEAQHWFSGEPSVSKVSTQAKYIFTQMPAIKPYVGAFYRQTFIDDFDDEFSFGGRAGVFFSDRNGVYVGTGIVYEQYDDCSRFEDCSTTYPEVLMSVSF